MFEIVNNSGKEIEELDFLKEYVEFLVRVEKLGKAIFNIIFVSNEEIWEINKEYRGVDRVTDVISFALEDNGVLELDGFRMLGDIYVAVDVAYEQAVNYNHSRKREVCFLVTHGLLHLLGYDHMEKEDEVVMFKKQEDLLKAYEITRE